MDELDKRLYNLINTEEKIPENFRTIIRESIKDSRLNKNVTYSFIKIVLVACTSLLATGGIAFAAVVISNNIWKQPEKIVGSNSSITEKEENRAMSEAEATVKANELLKKFGHENEKIKLIKLENNSNNYELIWHIETDKENSIEFDAEGKEKYLFVKFHNTLDKDIYNCRTTEKEAVSVAKKLCKQYGYNSEEYNEVNIRTNLVSKEDSYIWYVDFNKKKDGVVNKYETISIGFIPEINELYYFVLANKKSEDNPVKITEEQAKHIVTETETKINTGYKIKDIYINIDIAKMNSDAYARITDYEQYSKQKYTQNYPSEDIVNYRINSLFRKAWMVTVEYDISNEKTFSEKYYTYYIDVTTGEIIGGSSVYYSET